jgi:gamma-glutamylcyclotransferase (GGCT)/AIG2-like uncharacterized protein YtfP
MPNKSVKNVPALRAYTVVSLLAMQRLFVYGTLAPGRANHRVLKSIPGSREAATLRGNLLQEGWGVAMGYPGIVPTEDGEEVEGFVFSSAHLSDHCSTLDAYQ